MLKGKIDTPKQTFSYHNGRQTKSPDFSGLSVLLRSLLDLQLVEVPGIEPGSEDHTQKASTCLYQFLF
jgi:hypothetical protein